MIMIKAASKEDFWLLFELKLRVFKISNFMECIFISLKDVCFPFSLQVVTSFRGKENFKRENKKF